MPKKIVIIPKKIAIFHGEGETMEPRINEFIEESVEGEYEVILTAASSNAYSNGVEGLMDTDNNRTY